jgi:hypothetical protein
LIGDEVNPVIKALRASAIEVTALHSHMLDERPRPFFMHFWANDDAAKRRPLRTAFIAGLLLCWSSDAFAYRPFDGTDAAVADPGEVEIELQPAGVLWNGGQKALIAPATVFNYGLIENWEAVLEGQVQTPFSPSGPTSLSQSGAFLKHVIRPGVLQDRASPPSLVFSYRIAVGTAGSAQALLASCRSDGIGERFI